MQSSACIINSSPPGHHTVHYAAVGLNVPKLLITAPGHFRPPGFPKPCTDISPALPDVAKHSKTPTSSPLTSLRPVGQNGKMAK